MFNKIKHTDVDSALTIARVALGLLFFVHTSPGDETLIARAPRSTMVQPPTAVPGGKHWHFGMLFLVMPVGAVSLLVYLLRNVPANILRQEFEGFGAVGCALAYVAIVLWRVIRAVAEDARQAGMSGHVETIAVPPMLSEQGPKPAPSGNTIGGYEPVEERT